MRRQSILVVVVLAFIVELPKAEAYIYFNDGNTHDIDYVINEGIYVRDDTFGNPTTVNLLPGGSIMDLASNDNSSVMISGGWIVNSVVASGNSSVAFSDGSIGDVLYAFDSSHVTVYGGSIGDEINSYGGLITISGGSIGTDLIAGLNGADRGVLVIEGSGFAIDGTPVDYGELQNVLGDVWTMEPDRRLTGTLLSGDQIDNFFYINEGASIFLVPEPATLLLLGFGAVMLRSKRCSLVKNRQTGAKD